MSRGAIAALVASLLVAFPSGAALADTIIVTRGLPGQHHLVDTRTKPGVACEFGAVGGGLRRLEARPPVAFARDRTSGVDRAWISIRAYLQRLDPGSSDWQRVATSAWETRQATDSDSPFSTPHAFARPGTGQLRLTWELAWYGNGTDQPRTGYSRRRVDRYEVRVGGWVQARVEEGSCAAPRDGARAVSVSAGPRASPRVALTFDMGGRIGDAVEIVEWLDQHAVPATIFVTGQSASTDAGQQILSIADGAPDRFSVGNHSYDHADFTTLNAAQIADQLRRADEILIESMGSSSRPLFRPPYGRLDRDGRAAVGAAGWSLSVLWDVTTNDYTPPGRGGPSPSELTDYVLDRVQNGSIVLLHLGGYSDFEALPDIVAGLEQRGLQPVTLDQLFEL